MAVLAQDLRDAVLQAAISGKLTEQLDSDSSVEELLSKIKAEKEQLIKDKKIKKEKPLAEIEEDDCPFVLPNTWKWVRLDDIVIKEIKRGKSPKYNENGSNTLVFAQKCNSKYNGIQLSLAKYLDESILSKYSEEENMQDGDIVINSTGGGTMGRVGYYETKYNINNFKVYPDSHVTVVRVNPNILSKYIRMVIKNYQPFLERMGEGSTNQTELKPLIIKNLLIPIPPIEEQARIVAKVEEIMQKIDEYEKIEKQLEDIKKAFPMDMRDALLQAAMQGKLTEQLDTDSSVDDLIEKIKAERQKLEAEGKVKKSKGKKKAEQNDYFVELPKDEYPYDIPENWKITNIQNVCTLYTGNSISESIKKSKYTNLKEGYNYIGTKDVEFNRTITYENGVKIPFSEEKFVYSYPNSTLLCIEGGSAGRKIAITKEKVCFGNKLCTFNPISINYKFLYYYLQSPLFLSAFNNSLSGIITGVSLNKIKELNIVIPPIEEQQRIVETLDRLLPLCEAL